MLCRSIIIYRYWKQKYARPRALIPQQDNSRNGHKHVMRALQYSVVMKQEFPKKAKLSILKPFLSSFSPIVMILDNDQECDRKCKCLSLSFYNKIEEVTLFDTVHLALKF